MAFDTCGRLNIYECSPLNVTADVTLIDQTSNRSVSLTRGCWGVERASR